MNTQEKRPSGCGNIQNGPAVEKCTPAQFHRPYSTTEELGCGFVKYPLYTFYPIDL